MKKYLTLLCMITCTLLFTACGNEAETTDVNEQLLDSFTSSIVGVCTDTNAATTYLGLNEYDLAMEEATWQQAGLFMSGEVLLKGIESFQSAVPEMGENPQVTAVSNEIGKGDIVATVTLDGSVRDAEMVILYTHGLEVKSIATNVEYTFSEQMVKAGMNTLLGMGSVFSVLVLIMFIISLFKYISVFEERAKNKNATSEAVVEQVVTNIAEKEEVIEVDQDCELVAVIAAAIAASEGAATTDGFVVRSIRKHK